MASELALKLAISGEWELGHQTLAQGGYIQQRQTAFGSFDGGKDQPDPDCQT
jgi:hypothetical protein